MEVRLQGENLDVVFQQLDITDRDSVDALRHFVAAEYGSLDLLVNNAGLAFPMESDVPFAEQARVTIDTNYYGTRRMLEVRSRD